MAVCWSLLVLMAIAASEAGGCCQQQQQYEWSAGRQVVTPCALALL